MYISAAVSSALVGLTNLYLQMGEVSSCVIPDRDRGA